MRLVIAALALGLAAPAAAQPAGVPGLRPSPIGTQQLAAGEVLLEVNAMGTAITRADLALLTVMLEAGAATEAEARLAVDAATGRIVAAARAAGAAADDITVQPGATPASVAVAMAMRDMERAAAEAGGGGGGSVPDNRASARGAIEIRVHDLRRLDPLRQALEAAGAENVAAPVYSLADNRSARAEARRQAIAAARADAEDYAAALGMRVVRIVRVTDRVGLELFGSMMSESNQMRRMMGGMTGQDPDITTIVPVGMDFALAPR